MTPAADAIPPRAGSERDSINVAILLRFMQHFKFMSLEMSGTVRARPPIRSHELATDTLILRQSEGKVTSVPKKFARNF